MGKRSQLRLPIMAKGLDLEVQRRLAAHLHRIKSEHGIATDEALGQVIGASKSGVNRILNGQRAMSLDMLLRLYKKYPKEDPSKLCDQDPPTHWYTELDRHGTEDRRVKKASPLHGLPGKQVTKNLRGFKRMPAPDDSTAKGPKGEIFEVVDIAPGGIGIRDGKRIAKLEPGQEITLSIDGGAPMRFRIVWTDGHRAGLKVAG